MKNTFLKFFLTNFVQIICAIVLIIVSNNFNKTFPLSCVIALLITLGLLMKSFVNFLNYFKL